jgi:hypothetical protein
MEQEAFELIYITAVKTININVWFKKINISVVYISSKLHAQF